MTSIEVTLIVNIIKLQQEIHNGQAIELYHAFLN